MPDIDTLNVKFSSSGAKAAIRNITSMATAVESLAKSINAIDASKLSGLTNSMETIKRSIPSQGQVDRLVDFAAAVEMLSQAVGQANMSGFAQDMSLLKSAVTGFGKQSGSSIANAVQAMSQFAQQTQQAANNVQQMSGNSSKQQQAPTFDISQFNSMIKTLDKVQIKAKGLFAGLKVPTNKFKALEDSAKRVRKKYDEVREAMIQALSGGKMTVGDDAYKKKEAELDALRNKYNELILKQRELAQAGQAFTINPNVGKAFSGIQQSVNGFKQAFGGVSTVVKTVNKNIDGFISKVLKIGSASRKAKKDTTSLTDTVKRLSKEFTRLGKMMKLMVTRMALRQVIAQVGNGFKSLAIHSAQFNSAVSGVINSSKTLGYSFAAMVEPIFNAVAPALIYLIGLVTRVINVINQLFTALGGGKVWHKAKNFTDSYADSLQKAGGAAKELKKTVLGFDELNQLQDSSSSGGGADNGIADMFEDVPIDSKIKEWADKIKEWAKKLFEPIKNAWDKVGDWVKSKWKYALDEMYKLGASIARDFWRVWEQPETEQIFKNIFIILGEIGRTIGNLARQFRIAWDENETGYKILESIRDIILIITNHLRNMATATADWAATLDFRPLLTSIANWLASLEPAIDAVMQILEDFYKEVVLKFTKWVIESGLPALIDVFTRFNEEVDWDGLRTKLLELWKHLEPFMETVGEGLIIFIERVTTALNDFINGEAFADFLDRLEKWMDSVTPEDVADGIEKLLKALVAFKVLGAIFSALSVVAPIITAIVTACRGLGAVAGGVSTFVSAIVGLGGAVLPIVAIAAIVATAIYSLVASYGGFEEVGKKIADTFNTIKDNLKGMFDKSDIPQKINDLKAAFANLGSALGGLKSAWDILFKIIELVASYIGGLVIKNIGNAIKVFSDFINMISGVIKIIGGFADILVGVFTGDTEKAKEGVDKLVSGVKDLFGGMFHYLVDIAKMIIDAIVSPFKTAKYLLVGDPIVVDMWEDVKEVFDKAIGKIVGFVTNLKDNVIKLFTTIRDNVKERIEKIKEFFGNLSDKAKDLRDKVTSSFNDLKDKVTSHVDKIKEKVKTFKDDWKEKLDNIKTNLQTFKDDASEKLSGFGDTVKEKFETAKRNIDNFKADAKSILDDTKKHFNDFMSDISDALSRDSWTFDGVADGLKRTFEDAKSAVKGVWNDIANTLNGTHDIGSSSIRINLPKFATGGFPEDGLFMANHNELVGEFSNGRTAVANNAQITKGIENATYNAMMSALSQNSGGSSYIANEIIVDGDVIARTITKAQKKMNNRYSPQGA